MRTCMHDRGNHAPHNAVLTHRIDASSFNRPTRPLINQCPPSPGKRSGFPMVPQTKPTTILTTLNRAELQRDQTARACCLPAEYIDTFSAKCNCKYKNHCKYRYCHFNHHPPIATLLRRVPKPQCT